VPPCTTLLLRLYYTQERRGGGTTTLVSTPHISHKCVEHVREGDGGDELRLELAPLTEAFPLTGLDPADPDPPSSTRVLPLS
jgi:hypothetical protein